MLRAAGKVRWLSEGQGWRWAQQVAVSTCSAVDEVG